MLFLIAAQLRAHDRGVVQLVWECARSLWLNVNAMRILRSNFEEDSLFLNLSSYPIARRGAIAVAPIKFEIALAMTDMTMRVVLLEAVAGGRGRFKWPASAGRASREFWPGPRVPSGPSGSPSRLRKTDWIIRGPGAGRALSTGNPPRAVGRC